MQQTSQRHPSSSSVNGVPEVLIGVLLAGEGNLSFNTFSSGPHSKMLLTSDLSFKAQVTGRFLLFWEPGPASQASVGEVTLPSTPSTVP